MATGLHFGQKGLCPGDDSRRKTGEPRDVNPVGPVGSTVDDLMQKNDLSLPLTNLHRMAGQPFKVLTKGGEFMIMRREQRTAAIHGMEMFQRRPGNGKPVIGRRAAADLVEDHKRAIGGAIQNGGGLDHFNHEGGPAARQVIGSADAAEKPVDDTDGGAVGRHEQPGLGHDGNMRILPQKSGFACHVRAGDQPDISITAELAVIGDEALTGCKHGLNHCVPATDDVKTAVIPYVRTAEIPAGGQRRRCHGHINSGEGSCRRRQVFRLRQNGAPKPIENFQFARQSPVCRRRQVAFQFGKLGGGEPHCLRGRLAMNKAVILHQLFGMRVAHIDMIAEHVVMLDLQRRDPGGLTVALL